MKWSHVFTSWTSVNVNLVAVILLCFESLRHFYDFPLTNRMPIKRLLGMYICMNDFVFILLKMSIVEYRNVCISIHYFSIWARIYTNRQSIQPMKLTCTHIHTEEITQTILRCKTKRIDHRNRHETTNAHKTVYGLYFFDVIQSLMHTIKVVFLFPLRASIFFFFFFIIISYWVLAHSIFSSFGCCI